MATTKYTNREALHAVAAFLRERGCEDADLIAKVDTMATAADKRAESQKNAPRVKSKEQREREERAALAAKIMKDHGEPVTAAWISDHVPMVPTASKANGVMRTAINMGIVEKAGKTRNGGSELVLYRAL